jgi:excisionase family DNA binding protein
MVVAEQLPQLLLSPREAASALAISERTLFTLTKRGEIPPVRFGRAIRYELDALRACIAKRSTTGK